MNIPMAVNAYTRVLSIVAYVFGSVQVNIDIVRRRIIFKNLRVTKGFRKCGLDNCKMKYNTGFLLSRFRT